jgi:hypothetical protein
MILTPGGITQSPYLRGSLGEMRGNLEAKSALTRMVSLMIPVFFGSISILIARVGIIHLPATEAAPEHGGPVLLLDWA